MARKANLGLMVVVIMIVLVGAGSAWAVEVLEPGYNVEIYAHYGKPGIGGSEAMTFGGDGNMYVTHVHSGSIWRINPAGVATEFVTGLSEPEGMEWGGGTPYGDYLYVVEYGGNRVTQVTLDGTVQHFGSMPTGGHVPRPMGLDRTGNYRGHLYVATRGQDHTYEVDFDGTITKWSDFPGWKDGGGPLDIDFGTEPGYNGLMYISTYFVGRHQSSSGLFTLDTSRVPTIFTTDIVAAHHIKFDRGGDFGNELFVNGLGSFEGNWSIWRVRPDGSATEFARTTFSNPRGIAFSPNGAMYIAEYDNLTDTVIINRIYLGEPTLLEAIEIIGPNEVAEDFQAQYKAIAYYDNDSSRDVTDSVDCVWSVEPNDIAAISAGLLTTEMVDLPKDVTITAEYGTEIAEKEVSILAICPSGSALEFDGVDDYVEIHDDDSLEGMDELTISMWVKPDSFSNYDCLIHKGTWGEGFAALIGVGDKEGIWWGFDVGSGKRVHVRENPTIGKWVFITLWFKGGDEWRIYMDGQLKAHSACVVSTIPTTGTKNIRIGGTYTRTFDGSIEEVSIYNRALSAEEIWELMHTRPDSDDPNLVAYWDFDEGEGEIAGDSSGNGNNGAIVGAAWVESDAPVGICYPVAVDIKPGSCPNPLNLASRGVLPAAILGSEDLDVTTIDPGSIFLEGAPTIRTSYEDVATPVSDGNECECIMTGPDGYTDLTLKFKTQEIVEALINLEGQLEKGQVLSLELTGELADGKVITGTDCVKLVGNVSKWLEAGRWDANEDGVVNFLDLAELANYWLESSEAQ